MKVRTALALVALSFFLSFFLCFFPSLFSLSFPFPLARRRSPRAPLAAAFSSPGVGGRLIPGHVCSCRCRREQNRRTLAVPLLAQRAEEYEFPSSKRERERERERNKERERERERQEEIVYLVQQTSLFRFLQLLKMMIEK